MKKKNQLNPESYRDRWEVTFYRKTKDPNL